jgi:hypothetical protein
MRKPQGSGATGVRSQQSVEKLSRAIGVKQSHRGQVSTVC